jgi:hypothetical protein
MDRIIFWSNFIYIAVEFHITGISLLFSLKIGELKKINLELTRDICKAI